MARLFGVDLPREKRIEVGLTYIYGIGPTTSKKVLAETGIDPDKRTDDLTEEDLVKLRDYIQNNLKVEGDLHREGFPRTLNALWKSAATVACVIARALARSRSAHPHERPYPQGSPQANRRQEEVVRKRNG